MSNAPSTEPPPTSRLRRALPFVLALGLVALVLYRLDLTAFRAHLATVNAPAFLLFAVVFLFSMLTADTFATVVVYRRTLAPIRFRDFWVLRGASYLPSVLNHHVGQAFITYFLARFHGVSLTRAVGATLLAYVTWGGCVLGLGIVALILLGQSLVWCALIVAAGLGYLALVHAKPARVAKMRFVGPLVAPLFEVGVAGHLIALAARLPHVVVLILGTWIPFEFFGIRVPLAEALARMPIVMVAVTLPLTPQGLGTRDMTAALLLERFAPGATHAERLAALGASTLSWSAALTLLDLLVGFVMMRLAMPQLVRRHGGDSGFAERPESANIAAHGG